MKSKISFWIFIGIIFIIAALLILNDNSFTLMGIGFIIVGFCVLLTVNQKKWFTFFIQKIPIINKIIQNGILSILIITLLTIINIEPIVNPIIALYIWCLYLLNKKLNNLIEKIKPVKMPKEKGIIFSNSW